jgi:hypothetical protein
MSGRPPVDPLRRAFADAFMRHPTGRMTDMEVMAVLAAASPAPGGRPMSERPPVDPLREALERIVVVVNDMNRGYQDAVEEVHAVAALALASPAARPWHESTLHAKYGWHADCPECASPAAPRPEGLDAAEHDAGTCPTCRSRLCIGRLDYEDCAAPTLLSDTRDTP